MSDVNTAADRRREAPELRPADDAQDGPRPVANHGSSKEAEATDPLELIGNVVPGDADYLARCFVEEFAAMGYDGAAILELFRDPRYVAVHTIYRRSGEGAVRRLVGDVLAECGVFKVTVETPRRRRERNLVQIEMSGTGRREER